MWSHTQPFIAVAGEPGQAGQALRQDRLLQNHQEHLWEQQGGWVLSVSQHQAAIGRPGVCVPILAGWKTEKTA